MTRPKSSERPSDLTVERVLRKVSLVEAAQGDNEAAHDLEDELYRTVLYAIAHGAESPRELANAVLRTQLLNFRRWTA